MTIENALDVYLRTDATLMNLIGGGTVPSLTVARLYWMQAPEGCTLPYVVFTMVSDTDQQEFFSAANAGQGRAQFDVVGTSRANKNIEERIRTLLRHYRGTLSGLVINAIYPINRRERFNADTGRYVFSADYEVHCEY